MKLVESSATVEITNLAAQLKAAGKDIISLSVGEPDFETPNNIKSAAIFAIENGKTRYTAPDGISELKSAISKKYWVENALKYNHDEIMVSTGAKQVIFNALLATVYEKDEVIIPAPYWVSYPEIVKICGATPIIIKNFKKNSFKIDASDLEARINKKTKWIILNSPNNPTGYVYTKQELSAISKVLLKYPNILVMSDDIYEHILFTGQPLPNILEIEPKLKHRTLLINGLSKGFAMTGWRIGYCAGNKQLIDLMKKVQGQSTSNPTSISQYAATEALNGNKEFLIIRRNEFEERRNFMVNKLNKIRGINCDIPDGAFYLFPSISKLIGKKVSSGSVIRSDSDFTKYLLKKAGVAVVNGSSFGYPNHVRISYANSIKVLKEACERLKNFCDSLS